MNDKVINPILLLVFNRLDTIKQVLSVVKQAHPMRLYIACDGPRSNVGGELEKVQAVRNYITSNINWPCKVETLFRENNLGCKLAVSTALDWFFDNEEMGIILEDDCLPDLSFFQFCDELLERYKNDERVAIISGDNFNQNKIGSADYYFSKIPHIWGWATWRRTWQQYDLDISKYPDFREKGLIKDIWTDKNVQNYWIDIFDEVYNNKINTWDYHLTFSVFLNKKLCVCPNINLVSNIGFGKDFTNTLVADKRVSNLVRQKIVFPLKHPAQQEYNEGNDLYVNKIYLKNYRLKKYLKKFSLFKVLKYIYSHGVSYLRK